VLLAVVILSVKFVRMFSLDIGLYSKLCLFATSAFVKFANSLHIYYMLTLLLRDLGLANTRVYRRIMVSCYSAIPARGASLFQLRRLRRQCRYDLHIVKASWHVAVRF
jgi:hypothetical protein